MQGAGALLPPGNSGMHRSKLHYRLTDATSNGDNVAREQYEIFM